jgi:SpoVK/Ycf46/Vps4 family AAA+-type ATPase
MFCNYCGAQNPGDARFCSACGKAIAAGVQFPTASQAPQPARPPQAARASQNAEAWDRLVLPEDIKQTLQNTCRLLREAAQNQVQGLSLPNLLLFGPPGTGKTAIARTLAGETNVGFVVATAADLKSPYIGQSANLVRGVFEKARSMAPAILFIDEIETVAVERSSHLSDSLTRDITTELLLQMDRVQPASSPMIVVAASTRPDQIDQAILNRFRKIEIPLPDEAARRAMLKQLVRGCGCPLDPALDVDEVSATLAKDTSGMSGRALKSLVDRAALQVVMASASRQDVLLTRESLLAAFATRAPKAP